jgi:hypothetical protein
MTITFTTRRARGYFDGVLSDTPRPHPDPGCGRAFVTPSVSADVLLNDCGQPVLHGGNRSRSGLGDGA